MHDYQIVEGDVAANGCVAACRVVVNQATGHPEAFRCCVSNCVINTTALTCCLVSCDFTAIECQRAVVQDTATVACGVTADNLTTLCVCDGQNAVVDDDATVCCGIGQRAVDGLSVQFEDDGLAGRNGKCCVGAFCRDVLCQFDDTTCGHGGLQCCPAVNAAVLLAHVKAGILALHFGDFTVLRSYMQRLLGHACLCRKAHYKRIGVRTVAVVIFSYCCEIAKWQVYCICTAHECCAELVGLVTTAVADDTCLFAVARPYIVTEGFVELFQKFVFCPFYDERCVSCAAVVGTVDGSDGYVGRTYFHVVFVCYGVVGSLSQCGVAVLYGNGWFNGRPCVVLVGNGLNP